MANFRVFCNLRRTKGSTLNKGELSAKLTEGIVLCSYKLRTAPKYAAFESPQALRASVPTLFGPSGHFPP